MTFGLRRNVLMCQPRKSQIQYLSCTKVAILLSKSMISKVGSIVWAFLTRRCVRDSRQASSNIILLMAWANMMLCAVHIVPVWCEMVT